MKRFSEQLNKKAQSVKLQAAEKNELRERLVSYMEYHPLTAEVKSKSVKKTPAKLVTDAYTTVSIPFSLLFKSSAVAAAVVLVVVPVIAEKSVPGDTLYAVKVQFNEEVRSSLTFDSYQKVEWETERLNRRIAEARLLANEGRLTEEIEAEVAEAVKEHTQSAQKEIEVLKTQDADEAAIAVIALDATLKVQSDTLRSEESKEPRTLATTEESSAPVGLIAAAIEQSLDVSEAQNASSSLPAYEKLMARVERNTTRIYELLNTLEGNTDETKIVDLNRRSEDIERSVAEIVSQLESDESLARQHLVEVLQRTQGLIVFMTELLVAEEINVEEVVPVVLTEEEKTAYIASSTESLTSKIANIQSFVSVTEEVNVAEKLTVTVGEIETMSLKMASSTEFTEFKVIAAEAHSVADDTLQFIETMKAPEKEIFEEDAATTTPDTIVDEGKVTTTETGDGLDGEPEESDEVAEPEPTEASTTKEVVEDVNGKKPVEQTGGAE